MQLIISCRCRLHEGHDNFAAFSAKGLFCYWTRRDVKPKRCEPAQVSKADAGNPVAPFASCCVGGRVWILSIVNDKHLHTLYFAEPGVHIKILDKIEATYWNRAV